MEELHKKQCTKCSQFKQLCDFYVDISKKGGLSSYCKECQCNRASMWAKKNQKKHNANGAAWKKKNKEKVKFGNAIYHKNNKEYNNLKSIRWARKNQEQDRANHKKWKETNRDKVRFYDANRRAAKLQRTPKWLSKEQLREIEQFYIEAHELSWLSEGGLHVDHVVPLQGKNVSGLHVPWNLQIIPGSNNRSKSNKFIG